MDCLKQETENFIEQIKSTEIFQNYNEKKIALKQDSDLWYATCQYRRDRFEMQRNTEEAELYDRIDDFEKKYRELLEKKSVADYLDAEVSMCRLLQNISVSLIQALEYE